MTEQKPGETIFEHVSGHIDFLKPSTEEKRIKDSCTKCGIDSSTTFQNVKVITYMFSPEKMCLCSGRSRP